VSNIGFIFLFIEPQATSD